MVISKMLSLKYKKIRKNLEHLYEFDDDEEYDWLNDNEEDYEL